jgi:hypothetical protein
LPISDIANLALLLLFAFAYAEYLGLDYSLALRLHLYHYVFRVWSDGDREWWQRVGMMAFEQPELSPPELATRFTDTNS